MRNKNSKTNTRSTGFTLIEIMVIISIMALLSSMIMYNVNRARQKGRDAKRMADLKQMDTALQLYIQDVGYSPRLGSQDCQANQVDVGRCVTNDTDFNGNWTRLRTDLSQFMTRLPKDPCGRACYSGSGDWFTYTYVPPAGMLAYCVANNCGLTESELNTRYIMHAGNMETLTYFGFNRGPGGSW